MACGIAMARLLARPWHVMARPMACQKNILCVSCFFSVLGVFRFRVFFLSFNKMTSSWSASYNAPTATKHWGRLTARVRTHLNACFCGSVFHVLASFFFSPSNDVSPRFGERDIATPKFRFRRIAIFPQFGLTVSYYVVALSCSSTRQLPRTQNTPSVTNRRERDSTRTYVPERVFCVSCFMSWVRTFFFLIE